MVWFGGTITVPSSAQDISRALGKYGMTRVKQFLVRVRSMGTASYIQLQGPDGGGIRLTQVGAFWSVDVPQGQRYVDIGTLYIVSDTADAVVEVSGDSYDKVF